MMQVRQKTLQILNTPRGWSDALVWSRQLQGQHVWGIENSGSHGKGLAQFLVGQSEEAVREVSLRRTAQYGRRARKPDKNDEADALAIARLLIAVSDDLPEVRADDLSNELRLLSDHRNNLLAERVRLIDRLHTQMRQLDPGHKGKSGPLPKKEDLVYCQDLRLPPRAAPPAHWPDCLRVRRKRL